MTPADVRASIADAFAEVREYVAERPLEFRVGWSAAFVVAVSLAVTPFELWVWALFADVFAAAMGLGAWCVRLRGDVSAANGRADAAEQLGNRLADALNERDDELAHADALITTLAAEAAAAPVPFTPSDMPARLYAVPEQREPTHDHLKADDAWFAALYDENGQHR